MCLDTEQASEYLIFECLVTDAEESKLMGDRCSSQATTGGSHWATSASYWGRVLCTKHGYDTRIAAGRNPANYPAVVDPCGRIVMYSLEE